MGYFFLWREKINSSTGGRYHPFPSLGARKTQPCEYFLVLKEMMRPAKFRD
jgi:hypothetical protein